MIFRQLFEPISCTYSYLIASRRGGEALQRAICGFGDLARDRCALGESDRRARKISEELESRHAVGEDALPMLAMLRKSKRARFAPFPHRAVHDIGRRRGQFFAGE